MLGLSGRVLGGLVAGRAPGQEVTTDLDVVVTELGVFRIVHAQELGFLAGAELEARNEVNELGDYGRHDKGVGRGGGNGGDLPANDLVVAVDKAAAGADVDAVEANDFTGGEKGVEDEADDTADAVLSKDVERVVDTDEKLDYKMLVFVTGS